MLTGLKVCYLGISKCNDLTFLWNDLTFLWNDLTFLWNDVTELWNDLTWNDLTMERSDRIPARSYNLIFVQIRFILRKVCLLLIPKRS